MIGDEHNDAAPAPSQPPESGGEGIGRVGAGAGYLGIPLSAVRVPEIIGAVIWALGVSVVGIIVLGLLDPSVTDPDLSEPAGIKLAVQAFGALGFISAAIGMAMIANRSGLGEALLRLGLGRGRRMFATFGLALLLYAGVALLLALVLQPQQEDIAESLGADKNAELIIKVAAGLLIVVGAALGEELFFRGIVFGGLRQTLSLWPAAAISGLLFGLPHLPQGDLAVGLQLSLFGAILAWAYERSGSLWVPIGLHGFNNVLAFYFLITGS